MTAKLGRNDPCFCGSGKKFKACCMNIPAANRPVQNGYDELVSEFAAKKIPYDQIEFYNHPNFMAQERRDPAYLEKYARFVNERPYSEEYLERARTVIPRICNLIREELARDGAKGACVNISMMLSKVLELEGFWNYCVKGALTINFSSESNIRSKYFWPVDRGTFDAAHAWVVAPPFTVLDLTLNQQPYKEGEEAYLPNMVLTETLDTADVEIRDIFSPEARVFIRPNARLSDLRPDIHKNIHDFPPRKVVHEGTSLKYITTAVSMPDSDLSGITGFKLSGRYPKAIYEESIKPVL